MRITAVGLLKDIMPTYIRQQWLCNDAHFQQLFRGCHPTKVVFELVAAYFVRWIYVCPSGCTMYIRTYCHVILMQNKYHPPRNLHLTNRDTHSQHTHTHGDGDVAIKWLRGERTYIVFHPWICSLFFVCVSDIFLCVFRVCRCCCRCCMLNETVYPLQKIDITYR